LAWLYQGKSFLSFLFVSGAQNSPSQPSPAYLGN
jgi:hypothetical protein